MALLAAVRRVGTPRLGVRSLRCCQPRHKTTALGHSLCRRPTSLPSWAIQVTAWPSCGGSGGGVGTRRCNSDRPGEGPMHIPHGSGWSSIRLNTRRDCFFSRPFHRLPLELNAYAPLAVTMQ
jgi:hypothetical protein